MSISSQISSTVEAASLYEKEIKQLRSKVDNIIGSLSDNILYARYYEDTCLCRFIGTFKNGFIQLTFRTETDEWYFKYPASGKQMMKIREKLGLPTRHVRLCALVDGVLQWTADESMGYDQATIQKRISDWEVARIPDAVNQPGVICFDRLTNTPLNPHRLLFNALEPIRKRIKTQYGIPMYIINEPEHIELAGGTILCHQKLTK